MPAKAIVTGIVLVILAVMLAYSIEYFIPLSKKADMDIVCRNALLRMENSGGMTEARRDELQDELEALNLEDVIIQGTADAKHGDSLTLHVECVYRYDRILSLFKREADNQRMVYEKTCMSRRVVN